jgi:outer membrane receptor protein involved in Fe transport
MQRIIVMSLTFVALIATSSLTPVLAQLAPGVTQSAAHTATVLGSVTGKDAKPVIGAKVQVIGPGAVLVTDSDAHGAFAFVGVPFGKYSIVVSSPGLPQIEREITVTGDISITVALGVQSPAAGGLKTIARMSTTSSGASINVTPASIYSINPTQYAFNGNVSWQQLLNAVPGVTVGGALNGGAVTNSQIPNSPFVPIILSINGALPYESATTLDGMPLSNTSFSSTPGAGVDLSALPMALFATADVVRGPGANAPSIVDSIGGSFVLHPPAPVGANSMEASFSNDAYGGYFANVKGTFHTGGLSVTAAYGFNNSPGPFGVGPVFGTLGSPVTIDGRPVSSSVSPVYLPNPVYGNCYCLTKTTLFGNGGLQSTEWSMHNGGIALGYQFGHSVTAEMFYAGSQATMSEAQYLQTNLFAPGTDYAGSLQPGAYVSRSVEEAVTPISQSASLLEEKLTANLGPGVLRLAALQNYTYAQTNVYDPPPSSVQLFGTGSYCDNAACTSTTPFVFNGQRAEVTFPPFIYFYSSRSTNSDFLASYDAQLGPTGYIGFSTTRSDNSGTDVYNESYSIAGQSTSIGGGQPVVTQGITEYRIHGGVQMSDRFTADASYYIADANYHVQNPADPTGNTWVDSPFAYSAPRLGLTWRVNPNAVVRASAGGGFALPPLFDLVGFNGVPQCNAYNCTSQLTNINLQPEKSFAFDVGSDLRLDRNTMLSADVYQAALHNQLFESTTLVGEDKQFHVPLYVTQYQNLGNSRFRGLNADIRHDVDRGPYWSGALGLTRGYIVSVPEGFYNQGGMTCNFTTGVGCTNTYAKIGPNFNGQFESTVPYANGSAVVGYRWSRQSYLDLQANYQGNNNAYFQPAFFEFDLHTSYGINKNVSLLATFVNIFGVHDQSYQVLTVNPTLLAPAVAGLPFPLYPIPYGPRTVTVTTNFHF